MSCAAPSALYSGPSPSRPDGRAYSLGIVPKFGWHESCIRVGLSSRFILATILTGLDEVLYKLFVLEKSTRKLAKELGTPTLFP